MQPLVPATVPKSSRDRVRRETLEYCLRHPERVTTKPNTTRDELEKIIHDFVDEQINAECWKNDTYTVMVRRGIVSPSPGWPKMTWLSIRRNDRAACRDWRDFQAIKNQLCGSECEGVELYPAESRLADGANQYHVWVIEDDSVRLPFGFNDRLVTDDTLPGAKQRPRETFSEKLEKSP